jgi:hypothetical protein
VHMKLIRNITLLLSMLTWMDGAWAAVDSYRYLHVTVETPWTIFLFLLVGVMAPFLLMGILVWRYAGRKDQDENSASSEEAGQ